MDTCPSLTRVSRAPGRRCNPAGQRGAQRRPGWSRSQVGQGQQAPRDALKPPPFTAQMIALGFNSVHPGVPGTATLQVPREVLPGPRPQSSALGAVRRARGLAKGLGPVLCHQVPPGHRALRSPCPQALCPTCGRQDRLIAHGLFPACWQSSRSTCLPREPGFEGYSPDHMEFTKRPVPPSPALKMPGGRLVKALGPG